MSKVILANSGDAASLLSIRWLKNVMGLKVVASTYNIGQDLFVDPLYENSISAGAFEVNITSLKEKFLLNYCYPYLATFSPDNFFNLSSYPLGLTFIVNNIIKTAREEGASKIAFSCRGDVESFFLIKNMVSYIANDLKLIFPIKSLDLTSNNEIYQLAKALKLPVEHIKHHNINIHKNIWGFSIRHDKNQFNYKKPEEDTRVLTKQNSPPPAKSRILTISFENGYPIALDNKHYEHYKLIENLNNIASSYQIGHSEHVRTPLYSTSKAMYTCENPGPSLLRASYNALAEIILNDDDIHFSKVPSCKYNELLFSSKWNSRLKKALDNYYSIIKQDITGTVSFRLENNYYKIIKRSKEM